MAEAPDPRKLAAEQFQEQTRNGRAILTVDTTEYTFRMGDLTARDIRDLRAEGLSVRDLIGGLISGAAELDRFAAVVWMARRQAGETGLTLDEVQASLRLDQLYMSRDEDSPEPAEDFPDPPPSGGS